MGCWSSLITCKNSGISTNPNVLADVDGRIVHTLALGRVKIVVDGGQHNVVTNECALIDGDAALVLKLAAHIDEYPLTLGLRMLS